MSYLRSSLCAADSLSFSHTRTTLTMERAVPIAIEVVQRVAFVAGRLVRLVSHRGFSAENIFPMRNSFQMAGVNTESDTAKVVNFCTSRNLPVYGLIGEPMRQHVPAVLPKQSISRVVLSRVPYPAITIEDYFPQKSLVHYDHSTTGGS